MSEGMLHKVATKQRANLLSRALRAGNALFRHGYRISRAGEMVSSSVRDTLGSVVQYLRDELSRHVDTRLRETAHLSDATAPPGRYESICNPYNFNLNPSMLSSVLTDLGAHCALVGGTSGLHYVTPSVWGEPCM